MGQCQEKILTARLCRCQHCHNLEKLTAMTNIYYYCHTHVADVDGCCEVACRAGERTRKKHAARASKESIDTAWGIGGKWNCLFSVYIIYTVWYHGHFAVCSVMVEVEKKFKRVSIWFRERGVGTCYSTALLIVSCHIPWCNRR